MVTAFDSLYHLMEYFKEEETCREFLIEMRWGGKPKCPHCKHEKVYTFKDGKTYKCAGCRKRFSVTVGSIFENSKIPLRKWFMAIYLCSNHKKGISSCQLARDLKITQKSAWFVLHRIRELFQRRAPEVLEGIVEVDETFVGGKEPNKQKHKRTRGLSGGAGKEVLLGVVQRQKEVRLFHVGSRRAEHLIPNLLKNIKPRATIMTDEYAAYKRLGGYYDHQKVNHAIEEYVRGIVHTNTIEGFFSTVKRTIHGTYHFITGKHMQRYCNEFSYRYNTRKISQGKRFSFAVYQSHERRLKYDQLTAA